MRSYTNNGQVHQWNLATTDLEMIAARENFKYEDFFETQEAAELAGKARSMTTNKNVFVVKTPEGFAVHSHGIEKKGWELVCRFKRGTKI